MPQIDLHNFMCACILIQKPAKRLFQIVDIGKQVHSTEKQSKRIPKNV